MIPLQNFIQAEQQTSGLLKWATGLAIFISCLGLLGLVIYTTNVRTKEIGIRKVFGASVANIVTILSKDFVSACHHCICYCITGCMVGCK